MILIVYGTRPEYIKVKSIIENIQVPYKTLFTGQHEDIAPNTGLRLSIIDGENRLDSIVSSCLNNENIFKDITHIMVQGDTTSAYALALTGFHRKIKVIHLEAGLRTYDKNNPYPEETNRRMISNIASIHLCPTEQNKQNLINEKCEGDIYVVGNTGLDNIKKDLVISYGNKILITLHRRENHFQIDKYFKLISKLASKNPELEFILPIHPNPNVNKHKSLLEFVKVIDPLPHDKLINILKECKFVISDSGGLQEECSFLNKKIIICRETTERPETLGTSSFLCKSPDELEHLFNEINNNTEVNFKCPYGDGNSYKHILGIFNKIIK